MLCRKLREDIPALQDCPLKEDEKNCSRSGSDAPVQKHDLTHCEPGMVMCADHTACFPKHWVCDGEEDCLDGSDEVGGLLAVRSTAIISLTRSG